MELDEFQIAHPRSGLPGHHHPIAAGQIGIGGVGKEVAAAAGGQHHGPGPEPVDAVLLKHLQAHTAAVFHPELQGHNPLALLEPGPLLHLPFQGLHQGATGAVLGVEHPPVAVGRLQSGAQAVAIPIKGHVQLEQALHAGRGLMHEPFDGLPIAEPPPGLEGVVHMAGKAVIRPGNRRDASLGPATGGAGFAAGIALGIAVLAEQEHPQGARQLQAGHQAGSSAAHHHHIPKLLWHGGRRHPARTGTKKAAGRPRRLSSGGELRAQRY